jgi:hypothetical protein
MRSHTLLSWFGYAGLCFGGYFFLYICLVSRFLAIGKRAGRIRFQLDGRVGAFPKIEPKSGRQLELDLKLPGIGAHDQPAGDADLHPQRGSSCPIQPNRVLDTHRATRRRLV